MRDAIKLRREAIKEALGNAFRDAISRFTGTSSPTRRAYRFEHSDRVGDEGCNQAEEGGNQGGPTVLSTRIELEMVSETPAAAMPSTAVRASLSGRSSPNVGSISLSELKVRYQG